MDAAKRVELGTLLCKKGPHGGIIGFGVLLILMGLGIFIPIFLADGMAVFAIPMGLFFIVLGGVFARFGCRVYYLREIHSYRRVDQRIHQIGIHTETNIIMEFVPDPRLAKPTIRISWNCGRKGDDDLDQFHDLIEWTMARRREVQDAQRELAGDQDADGESEPQLSDFNFD